MEKQITDILRNLMACASVTNTEKETVAETWMLDFFRKQSYFQTYPERVMDRIMKSKMAKRRRMM